MWNDIEVKHCSCCGAPRDRDGQRYCRKCHNAKMREGRRQRKWPLNELQRFYAGVRERSKMICRRLRIAREPCLVCGDAKGERHHFDYTDPYRWIWLCRMCQSKLHRGRLALCKRVPVFEANRLSGYSPRMALVRDRLARKLEALQKSKHAAA